MWGCVTSSDSRILDHRTLGAQPAVDDGDAVLEGLGPTASVTAQAGADLLAVLILHLGRGQRLEDLLQAVVQVFGVDVEEDERLRAQHSPLTRELFGVEVGRAEGLHDLPGSKPGIPGSEGDAHARVTSEALVEC
jgi:hypothetical protein